MARKGLSFTLTLVVVGVVLLMTALTVVTLGGSSLSNFFGFFQDQGEQAATDAQIREACNQLAQDIDSEYCGMYFPTAYSEGDGWEEADLNGDGSISGPDEEEPEEGYLNESDDEWREADCSGTPQVDRIVQSWRSAQDGNAYPQTGDAVSCDWDENSGFQPTVTVEGSTYNCLDRNYIPDTRCPAQ